MADVPMSDRGTEERPREDPAGLILRIREGLWSLEQLLEALEGALRGATMPDRAPPAAVEVTEPASEEEDAAVAPRKADSAAGLAWWLSPELPAFDGTHNEPDANGDAAPVVETPWAVEPSTDAPPAPEPVAAVDDEDAESVRQEVRLQVERLKAEIAAGLLGSEDEESEEGPAASEPAKADSEDVREKVRLEVEKAKAELLGETAVEEPRSLLSGSFGPRETGWASPASDAWQARALESSGGGAGVMPLLVVDDSEGRVQLARVYEALGRLGCAGEASLVNYTPHNVKITLNTMKAPEPDEIAREMEEVLGRPCAAQSDGSRITITVGQRTRAA